jgi:hypothetical protein
MPTDPNLILDSCFLMNDGPAPNWWLSEDVKITNPASGVAQLGMKNDVQLVVRRSTNSQCTMPEGSAFIKVDLYICDPTGSPFTTTSPKVKKILNAASTTPQPIEVDITNLSVAGASFIETIKWDLPSTPTHLAEQPGHKCMIARAYPDVLPGNNNLNFVPDDQHYAQRNICIQTCKSPCGVDVWTENFDEEKRVKDVTFRLVADLRPSNAVLKVVLPLLQEVPGFRQVVNRAPGKGFGLDLPDFPDAKLTDNTRPGCWGLIQQLLNPKSIPGPIFEAKVAIQPGQMSVYRFVTDLDGSEAGDAHIFHLMHMEQGQVLSGLTIVMVKT